MTSWSAYTTADGELAVPIAVNGGKAVVTVRGHRKAKLRSLLLKAFPPSNCKEKTKSDAKQPLVAVYCAKEPQQSDGMKSAPKLSSGYYKVLVDEGMTLEEAQKEIGTDDGPSNRVCRLELMMANGRTHGESCTRSRDR